VAWIATQPAWHTRSRVRRCARARTTKLIDHTRRERDGDSLASALEVRRVPVTPGPACPCGPTPHIIFFVHDWLVSPVRPFRWRATYVRRPRKWSPRDTAASGSDPSTSGVPMLGHARRARAIPSPARLRCGRVCPVLLVSQVSDTTGSPVHACMQPAQVALPHVVYVYV
jgi:hypothetical protein